MRLLHTRWWIPFLAATLAAGCNDPAGAPPVAAALIIVAGDSQVRAPGKAVHVPPMVEVRDSSGFPLRGVLVTFVATRLARVEPSGVPTDRQGRAAVTSWIPRPDGVEDTLLAVTDLGDTVRFRATAIRFNGISAGIGSSCGTTNVGLAFCWGANSVGVLGVGDQLTHHVPTRVLGPVRYTRFLAGNFANCGLGEDAQVYCAGALSIQQNQVLGDSIPVLQPGGLHFTDLALPESGPVCGAEASGKIYCWGSQLGPTPVEVPSQLITGFVSVSAAGGPTGFPEPESQVCGLTQLMAVACYDLWSVGVHLQTPFTPGNVVQVSETSRGVCSRDAAGGVQCYGPYYPTPGPVTGLPPVRDMEGALFQTCGATDNGIYCWPRGELVATPVPGSIGKRWRSVSVGFAHGCAIDDQGLPWCWGANGSGELGDSTTTDRVAPVPVVFDY